MLQIREQSLEVARSLAGLGLSKGDVVSVLLPNCLEYPAIVLGSLYLGLTVSPANPAYTPHEVSRQLMASEARLIFGHSTQIEKIKQTLEIMGEEAKCMKALIVGEKTDSCHGFIHWDDFLSMSSGQVPDQAEIDVKKDVAVLPFSSGTTGIPKEGFESVNSSTHLIITCSGCRLVPAQPGGGESHPRHQ